MKESADVEMMLRAIVSQHTAAGMVDGYAVAKASYRLAALSPQREDTGEYVMVPREPTEGVKRALPTREEIARVLTWEPPKTWTKRSAAQQAWEHALEKADAIRLLIEGRSA